MSASALTSRRAQSSRETAQKKLDTTAQGGYRVIPHPLRREHMAETPARPLMSSRRDGTGRDIRQTYRYSDESSLCSGQGSATAGFKEELYCSPNSLPRY